LYNLKGPVTSIVVVEIDVCASAPCIHGDCHAFGDVVEENEQPSHEINQMARRVLNEWLSKRGYDSAKNRAVRDIDEIAQQPGRNNPTITE